MQNNSKLEKIFLNNKDKILIQNIDNSFLTYENFWKKSLFLKSYLITSGLKNGDIVLVKSNNCLEYLNILISCAMGGFVFCPIDNQLKDKQISFYKKILNPKIYLDDLSILPSIENNDLIEDENIKINYDNNYLIMMTSGTSGEPKGMMFTLNNIIKSSSFFAKLVGYDFQSKIYHILPMHYMAGLINTFFSPLTAGSTIILGQQFSSTSLLDFWNNPVKYNANSLHLTPSIASFLADLSRDNLIVKNHTQNYREIISTGSYLFPNITKKFEEKFNFRLLSCYGITEAGGPLTLQNWEDTFIINNVGSHSPEVEFKSTKINSHDQQNTLFVKTPFMMKGYLNDLPHSLKCSLDLDFEGFFNTQDFADYENGKIIIKGRRKDIIKKSGELISLAHIENSALKIEHIKEVACIGIDDEIVGSKIIMFLVFNNSLDCFDKVAEIKNELKKSLKRIEIPDKFMPVPELPKTESGKILKRVLIDSYIN